MGFKPAVQNDGGRRRSPLISAASGSVNVARFRIGVSTTNAVAGGAEVPAGDVQTRVSQWCFGVSML